MGKKYLFEKILNKSEDDEEYSDLEEDDDKEDNDSELSDEDEFDADSDLDSDDAELQRAFAAGELEPGIHQLNAYKLTETLVNDKAGLKQKLADIQIFKDSWLERLDLVNEPAPATPELIAQYGNLDLKMNRKGEVSGEEAADSQHDFKREMLFYRQAQASAVEGLKRLKHQFGIQQTSRPDDYFAEMIKSDEQMKKVRERLQVKQNSIEASEKARKMRELKKYGKKVQQEVQIKRQQEKKEMLQKIKNYKKGKEDNLDFLDGKKSDDKNNKKGQGQQKNQKKVTKKQKYKETRYGYGGQKKRSKYNNADSAADMSSYSSKKHGKPRTGKKPKANRPGKARRANMRSKK